jgi:hypothetical protein
LDTVVVANPWVTEAVPVYWAKAKVEAHNKNSSVFIITSLLFF